MRILGNFYFFLGLIIVVAMVLSAKNFSLFKKMIMLLIFASVPLCIEKPDWFGDLLQKIGINL